MKPFGVGFDWYGPYRAKADGEAGGSLAGVIYAQCVVKQEAGRAAFLDRSR